MDLLESLARAICLADATAPDPDAVILIKGKPALVWEGRVEMARASIAALRHAHQPPAKCVVCDVSFWTVRRHLDAGVQAALERARAVERIKDGDFDVMMDQD